MREFSHFELTKKFKEDGFKTGRICLPGLDMWVSLEPVVYFKYDGPVPSIRGYLDTLPEEIADFVRKHLEAELGNLDKAGGFNQKVTLGHMIGFLMVVKDISLRANVSNEAHEAAEIACHLGLGDELERHFRSFGFDVPLNGLTPLEVGVVGGFIGAEIHGHDVKYLYQNQDPEGFELLKRLKLI